MNSPSAPAPAPEDTDLARVRELLPWYARGALGAEDHAFVQGWLLSHPAGSAEVMADLEWLCSTEVLLREAAQAQSAAVHERKLVDEGLSRLMARVRAEPAAARAGVPVAAPAPLPWWPRLQAWVAGQLPQRKAPLGWALAGLVAVQAGVIGVLLSTPMGSEQVPLGGSGASASADVVVFTIAFKPQATEPAIRALLSQAQGGIVGGPSALGLYRVAVPRSRADRAQAQFAAATAVVESAQRGP